MALANKAGEKKRKRKREKESCAALAKYVLVVDVCAGVKLWPTRAARRLIVLRRRIGAPRIRRELTNRAGAKKRDP